MGKFYHHYHIFVLISMVIHMKENLCLRTCRYRVAAVEWVQDILPPDRTKEQVDVSLLQL